MRVWSNKVWRGWDAWDEMEKILERMKGLISK